MSLLKLLRKSSWPIISAIAFIPHFAFAESAQNSGKSNLQEQNAEEKNVTAAFSALVQPPAHGQFGKVTIDISIKEETATSIETEPYSALFLGGVASIPMGLLNPMYGLGVFLPIVGSPLNAELGAKRDRLIQAFTAEPLSTAILAALKRRIDEGRASNLMNIQLDISGYGLTTRSGKPLRIFEHGEVLCLVTKAQLTVTRTDLSKQQSELTVGLAERDAETPPPICAFLDQFTNNDGAYLRQSIRELAEVIAALTLMRLEPKA